MYPSTWKLSRDLPFIHLHSYITKHTRSKSNVQKSCNKLQRRSA
ncbi:hypothetical protein MtrunA17_Chr4g0012561 [Medicago truncatula]|uniref:Uncharacterized protein n=1 Tax=Medicago truncatula TaxID=3880 RepID=A0A396I3L6_MEDTR|nr:hypothetical protein MtrunA17_Chr4g0012561 [Medicago truncatula]